MKQRTAILVAIGLTAFVVIMVAGIAFAITVRSGASSETVPENELAVTAGGEAGTAPSTAVPTALAPQMVQPQRAAQVALQVMPNNTLIGTPELVNFQGKMAYEVLLSGGTVYVDAFTAQVLSSSVTVTSNTVPNSAPNPAPNNPPPAVDQGQNIPAKNQPAFSDDNADDNGNDNGDDGARDDDSGHGGGDDDSGDNGGDDDSGHGGGDDD